MKNRAAVGLFAMMLATGQLFGQAAVSPRETSAPPAKKSPAPQQAGKKEAGTAGPTSGTAAGAPISTEIFADEAFFDSNKDIGTFTGHVKINDPRFTLQSEKLTVFVSKGPNQALQKAIAEGNVAVVRERPDPNGGTPVRSVGRADKATYIASSGDMELSGNPRVQEGVNIHVAISPDTVMIINQKGQLTTHGPSRTEIRQAPKIEQGEKKPEGSPVSPTP